MPLIQGKSKASFSHNVSAEMKSGRPQKQAVAIAYSEKAKAEHRKHLAMGGKVPGCRYCMGGYAEGGTVNDPSPPEPDPQSAQQMQAGANQSGWQPDVWKKNLGLSDGGMVDETGLDPDHETMLNECAEECMDAVKNGDRSAFRNALEVLVTDILGKQSMEDEE